MSTLPAFSEYDGQFVSPRLAVGRCPKFNEVRDIAAAGVRGILNLVSVCEARSMEYVHYLPTSIYWLHLAFWDGYQGPDTSGYGERLTAGYARHVVRRAAVAMRDHGPLLVHCMGGVGRSGNLTAILLAGSEGLTPDEAIAHIRQYRPSVAPFSHDGLWKEAGGDALVGLARDTLQEPSALPQGISPFLSDKWQMSRLFPPANVVDAPYFGMDHRADWQPLPARYAFVEVHELCGTHGLVYLARKVRAPDDGEWILHVGHDGGAKIFVDGAAVAVTAGTTNPAPYQRSSARIAWTAGEHEIVVAFDRANGLGWGIYVSFEPAESMQVPGKKIMFPG